MNQAGRRCRAGGLTGGAGPVRRGGGEGIN